MNYPNITTTTATHSTNVQVIYISQEVEYVANNKLFFFYVIIIIKFILLKNVETKNVSFPLLSKK